MENAARGGGFPLSGRESRQQGYRETGVRFLSRGRDYSAPQKEGAGRPPALADLKRAFWPRRSAIEASASLIEIGSGSGRRKPTPSRQQVTRDPRLK